MAEHARISGFAQAFPMRGANDQVREAWAAFLGRFQFQWFLTLTFATSVHPEAAWKLWRRFVCDLNRHLFGRLRGDGFNTGVFWVCAIELQKREVIHFHGLMGAVEDLNHRARRLDWMDRWASMAGYAKIEPIANDEAVNRYISKYVCKGGEIELSANLSSFTEQLSARRLR